MDYEGQNLQLRMYQLQNHPDEIEVILGLNGSAERRGDWREKGKYELPGDPNSYLDRFFGEGSRVIPLIKRPPYQTNPLYVGNLRMGLQFTIPISAEQAFVQIVESMRARPKNS